jgi:hypothetical protein
MINVKLSYEIDPKLDDFLDKNGNEDQKLFCSSQWLKMINRCFNYKYINFLFFEKEKFIGFIPFFKIKSILFGNRIVSIPFTGHGAGFILIKNIKDNLLQEIIKLFVEEINKLRTIEDFSTVIIKEENYSNELFIKNGFIFGEKEYTFKLDLTTKNELWVAFNKKVRNSIRKSEKNNLKLVRINDINQLYKIHAKTNKRLGSPVISKRWFEYVNELLKEDFIILFAKTNNRIIGDASFLIKNDTILWATNDCLTKYRNLNVSSFLLWQGILQGLKKRCKKIDLGSSRMDSNNYHFKTRWNPKVIEVTKKYYFFNKTNFISIKSKKYQFLVFLWKQILPEFLANFIGPKIREKMAV